MKICPNCNFETYDVEYCEDHDFSGCSDCMQKHYDAICHHSDQIGKEIDRFEGIPIIDYRCIRCGQNMGRFITLSHISYKYNPDDHEKYRKLIPEHITQELRLKLIGENKLDVWGCKKYSYDELLKIEKGEVVSN